MLIASVGKSENENSYEAGKEAAIVAALQGEAVDVALVFATTGYEQELLLKGVADVLPDVPITGCSAEGVIANAWSYEGEHGVVVLLLGAGSGAFHTLHVPEYAEDSEAAGRAMYAQLPQETWEQGKLLLLFPDGLAGDCTALLGALEGLLPPDITVLGGSAGDAMQMQRTFQYSRTGVRSGGLSGLLLSGSFEVHHCVSHGCEPIGSPRRVTRSEGGWVHEIDGVSAWSVFQEYLDGQPEELNADGIVFLCVGIPLETELAAHYDPFIVRSPAQLDKSTGALFFPGGPIPEGTKIQLTRRDEQKSYTSANQRVVQLVDGLGGPPDLVLQFDCAGRGQILYGAEAHEKGVRSLQRTLGHEAPWIGFHTYGEIAPVGGRNFYHNNTVALVALYSRGEIGAE